MKRLLRYFYVQKNNSKSNEVSCHLEIETLQRKTVLPDLEEEEEESNSSPSFVFHSLEESIDLEIEILQRRIVFPNLEEEEESSNTFDDVELGMDLSENRYDQEWWSSELPKYLDDGWPPPTSRNNYTIFRTPKHIRDCDEKAYEPTVVGIGLFNFRKGIQELSPRLHKHKHHCVSYILARHGSKEKAEELLEKCLKLVLALEPRARSCYSVDDESIGRHEFAEMLLQDGCFILRLLLKRKRDKRQEVDKEYLAKLEKWESEIIVAPMIGTLWIWNMVVYDLLKLENQIPFFVLQRLFDLLKTPADEGVDLVELALEFLSNIYPTRSKTFVPPPSSKVLHLLHLFHSSLIPPELENTMVEGAPHWIPSATVLQDAGFKFQLPQKQDGWFPPSFFPWKKLPKEGMTKSFLEVTFQKGVMEISPLKVDDSTSLVLRNLIAFEQCYPNKNKTAHITTYARFINYLINTPRDVRLLSLDGVLLNRLGTEEAVADVLSKLCDHVHYTPDKNYLGKVFNDVTKYYESSWHKWRATLLSKYLSNPWAIISVMAAVVLLILTIEQAAFAGLSYFHPPR